MQQRTLGQTGLQVATMGLGCMTIGRDYSSDSRAEAIRIIRRAAELGVTLFDTAEIYGPDNQNELLVGEALAPIRSQVVIATKCGIRFEGGHMQVDNRPETIRSSIERSLRRLRTDYVDLYYLHRVDPSTPIEAAAETMAQLQKEGKIRHWGISEPSMDTLRRANAVFPVAAVESEYSMMWREPEEAVLPTLEELGIGLTPYRPLARGFLTDVEGGAYLQGAANTRFDAENLPANLALRTLLQQLAREKQVTAALLALAWLLAQKPFIVPIPGISRMERMEENVRAAEVSLSAQELDAIRKLLDQIEIKGTRYDPDSDNGRSVRK